MPAKWSVVAVFVLTSACATQQAAAAPKSAAQIKAEQDRAAAMERLTSGRVPATDSVPARATENNPDPSFGIWPETSRSRTPASTGPNWQARFEEFKKKAREEFRPPEIGLQIQVVKRTGETYSGTLNGLTDTGVVIDKDVLTAKDLAPESQRRLLRDCYAAQVAREKVATEKTAYDARLAGASAERTAHHEGEETPTPGVHITLLNKVNPDGSTTAFTESEARQMARPGTSVLFRKPSGATEVAEATGSPMDSSGDDQFCKILRLEEQGGDTVVQTTWNRPREHCLIVVGMNVHPNSLAQAAQVIPKLKQQGILAFSLQEGLSLRWLEVQSSVGVQETRIPHDQLTGAGTISAQVFKQDGDRLVQVSRAASIQADFGN